MVDNFKIKMLIEINILISEDINLIIFIRISYINNYNIIFKFIIISLIRSFIK